MLTDEQFKAILEEEWKKLKPPVPMGERRLTLAIRCMRRAYEEGRASNQPQTVIPGVQPAGTIL